MKIKEMIRNEDFVGYFITLEDGRKLGCQFELENNQLHADFGTYYPVPVSLEDPCFPPDNFSEDEIQELKELFFQNDDIRAMAEELEEI